jgi:hypothetical protein
VRLERLEDVNHGVEMAAPARNHDERDVLAAKAVGEEVPVAENAVGPSAENLVLGPVEQGRGAPVPEHDAIVLVRGECGRGSLGKCPEDVPAVGNVESLRGHHVTPPFAC